MTTTQLEMCVRERFDMGLCEFMRHKVEAESLYDYEVASILNVDGALVSRLRKAFGINKANGFSRRFENTYGKGAIQTFKKIIANPDNGLADVASHFGFSREYAWQVYKKVYGRPYTGAFRKKILTRKHKKLDARMKSRNLVSLIKVIEKILPFTGRRTTGKQVHKVQGGLAPVNPRKPGKSKGRKMPRRGNRKLKIKHNRSQHQRVRTSRGTRTMSKIWLRWMGPTSLTRPVPGRPS